MVEDEGINLQHPNTNITIMPDNNKHAQHNTAKGPNKKPMHHFPLSSSPRQTWSSSNVHRLPNFSLKVGCRRRRGGTVHTNQPFI
jgi:hypothetical protein